MNTLIRFLLSTSVMAGFLTAHAERVVDVRLNKHNFEGSDTLAVNIAFEGFEAYPIKGDVRIEVVDTETDSLLIAGTARPIKPGIYDAKVKLPTSGFEKPEDITKLCVCMSIVDDEIYADGVKAEVFTDLLSNYSEKYKGFKKLKQIPFSQIIYLKFTPGNQRDPINPSRRVYELDILSNKFCGNHNHFIVRMMGTTEGGEEIIAEEPITIHKIYYYPYLPDTARLKDAHPLLLKPNHFTFY